jgi:hypothetical protein
VRCCSVGRRETTMHELEYSLSAFVLNTSVIHRKTCWVEPGR